MSHSLNPFCVYLHAANGTVFFVGSGRHSRAHSAATRTPEWKDIVRKAGGFLVEIIASYATPEAARERETAEIISRRPAANLRNGELLIPSSTRGGARSGAGRKPNSPLCVCGAMTQYRAAKRGHACTPPGPSVEEVAGNNSEVKTSRLDSLFEFGL